MKYKVIEHSNMNYFSEQVEIALRSGWRLHGGVFVYVDKNNSFYVQSLTKDQDKTEES